MGIWGDGLGPDHNVPTEGQGGHPWLPLTSARSCMCRSGSCGKNDNHTLGHGWDAPRLSLEKLIGEPHIIPGLRCRNISNICARNQFSAVGTASKLSLDSSVPSLTRRSLLSLVWGGPHPYRLHYQWNTLHLGRNRELSAENRITRGTYEENPTTGTDDEQKDFNPGWSTSRAESSISKTSPPPCPTQHCPTA